MQSVKNNEPCCTFERGIWDLLSRFTFWKLERLEKEKESRLSEDFLEAALSEDTADTPDPQQLSPPCCPC